MHEAMSEPCDHGCASATFTAMVPGVRDAAIAAELATPDAFDRGIAGLERTAPGGGVFCCTFFKAVAAGKGDRG